MKQYFLLGTVAEVASRIQEYIKPQEVNDNNNTQGSDDDRFVVHDDRIWVSVALLCEMFDLDSEFFTTDYMLDYMNDVKKKKGLFPIKIL